jgi:lysophospholipase L1-like esterase
LRPQTIWFGANDACLPARAQHVPLQKFKDNLHALVSSAEALGPATTVLLMTPPPISEPARVVSSNAKWGYDPDRVPDRKVEVTKQYAEAVKEVAETARVGIVDIYEAVESEALKIGNGDRDAGLQKFLEDGLHLTGDGYRVRRSSHPL